MKPRPTFAVRDRAAARAAAQAAADLTARPVLWGRPHGSTHTWLVNLKPCGSPEEEVFATLPSQHARRRPTFLPQVYEMVLWLEDRAARGGRPAAWNAEVLRIRDYIVDRAGVTLADLEKRARYAAVQAGVVNQPETSGGRVRFGPKAFGPTDVPVSGDLSAAWTLEGSEA